MFQTHKYRKVQVYSLTPGTVNEIQDYQETAPQQAGEPACYLILPHRSAPRTGYGEWLILLFFARKNDYANEQKSAGLFFNLHSPKKDFFPTGVL